MPMLRLRIRSVEQLGSVRHTIRRELTHRNIGDDEVATVELVVSELVGIVRESEVSPPILLTIETFPRLHSVRLHHLDRLELYDDPFHMRERVLQGLTLAFGQRRNADHGTDLWAEIPRQRAPEPELDHDAQRI
jgi:hypothetical protein